MTGHALANRILEADDDDLDIGAEVKRLSGTAHPGAEIEVEGNHWNVYRMFHGQRHRAGEIYYNDPSEIPPGVNPAWHDVHWSAMPLSPHIDAQHFKTFDEAVAFLAALKRPYEESLEDQDEDEPDLDPEAEIKRYSEPLELRVTNPPGYGQGHSKAAGKTFVAKITWPDERDMNYQTGYSRLQPLITFYDPAYPDEEHPEGQQISRYHAASIASMDGRHGLDLYGSEPAWKIAPEPLRLILNWLRQELEVKRRMKLKPDLFSEYHESLEDPDSPELFTNPERTAKQPKSAILETAFKAMLKPYYDQIDIQKTETNYFGALADYFHWRITCKRTTGPLKLPIITTAQNWWKPVRKTNGPEWRKQVESWFRGIADRHGMVLRGFSIYGRLRQDPLFTFETYRWKNGVNEAEDFNPDEIENISKDIIGKLGWDKDLEQALWKFHPYGCGYTVHGGHSMGLISVWTYFPAAQRDEFAQQVMDFAAQWLKEHRIMTINSLKISKWENGEYGQLSHKTGFIVYINCPQVADAMATDARRTSMLPPNEPA